MSVAMIVLAGCGITLTVLALAIAVSILILKLRMKQPEKVCAPLRADVLVFIALPHVSWKGKHPVFLVRAFQFQYHIATALELNPPMRADVKSLNFFIS